VYSNRTDGDIAFKHKLDYWQRVNPRIKIAYTVTECAPHDTTCSFGAIDARLIRERMCDWHDRLFYIFGPPRMVEAMSALCVGLGVPKDRIRAENFIGY
jgi:ferredoxin-NADP reductase